MTRTVIALLLLSAPAFGQDEGMPPSVSPTGYEPRVLWSPQRQGVYARMLAEKHPLMAYLLSQADKLVTGTPSYGDGGQYATIAYQVTGDEKYARAAWSRMRVGFGGSLTANGVREAAAERVVMAEWLWPALTDYERAATIAEWDRVALFCLGINQPQYVGGFSAADSDQTVGQYFFLALCDKLHGRDWLSRTTTAVGKDNYPVGGLTPTGGGTIRDAIAKYAALAEGGVWPESSAYNLGTLTTAKLGVEAVGPEHFPEYAALWPAIAVAQKAELTPDLASCFQWGDCEQRGIGYHLFYRLNLLYMLGENATADALTGRHGTLPWWRAFWLIDPYQPSSFPGPAVVNGTGTGVYFRKAADELFAVTFPSNTGLHHSGTCYRWGDFALYRGGQWVVDQVVGYGGGTNFPEYGNCVLLAGLGPMANRTSLAGQNGGVVGRTSGPYYGAGYYSPPPVFVHGCSRQITREGSAIVVTDMIDMDDPRTLPSLNRYRAADLARINTAGDDLIQLCFQCPLQPTIGPHFVAWNPASGQTVRVTWKGRRGVRSVVDAAGRQSVRLVPEGYTGGPITLITRVEVN